MKNEKKLNGSIKKKNFYFPTPAAAGFQGSKKRCCWEQNL